METTKTKDGLLGALFEFYVGKKAILGHKGIAPWGLVGALFEILYGKEGDSWSQGEFDATPPGPVEPLWAPHSRTYSKDFKSYKR